MKVKYSSTEALGQRLAVLLDEYSSSEALGHCLAAPSGSADGYSFIILNKYSVPKEGVLTKIRSFLKKIAAVGDSQIHLKNVSVRF